MAGTRFQIRASFRSVLAWAGLIVMALSVVWLESIPRIERPVYPRSTATHNIVPVVVLDPGHGGQDSGAMCGGILEKDLTLDIAQRLERRLHDQGVVTRMTRNSDTYVSLGDRAALTNRLDECIFVSIHFNEGNKAVSSGVETYFAEHQVTGVPAVASWLPFLQPVSVEMPNVESQSLAGFIQQALVARTHSINRGIKPQQFFVLANVRHPAVLVEAGFISNKDDAVRIGTAEYREELAAAIDDGIMRYREVVKNYRNAAGTPE